MAAGVVSRAREEGVPAFTQHPFTSYQAAMDFGDALFKPSRSPLDDASVARSQSLARQGSELCSMGRHRDAMECFTEAIVWNPHDHRFFADRSFCYSAMGWHEEALRDALLARYLEPRWPQNHFRCGKAHLALQMYQEASRCFEAVLAMDPTCEAARQELRSIGTYEAMRTGSEQESASFTGTRMREPRVAQPDLHSGNAGLCRSLWVGNVKPHVTRDMLVRLFRPYGLMRSVHMQYDQDCAIINYAHHLSAVKAVGALQGRVLCGRAITIRFADN